MRLLLLICGFLAPFAVSGRSCAAEELLAPSRPKKAVEGNLPVPAKVLRYCQRLMHKYDADGDGRLSAREWGRMRGAPQRADFDADGLITVEEFSQHVTDYARQRNIRFVAPPWLEPRQTPPLLQPVTPSEVPTQPRSTVESRQDDPAAPGDPSPRRKFYVSPKRLPGGLPNWFLAQDVDGDGQLNLAEFAPQPTPARLDQFARYDANGDGFVTAEECVRAGATAD